MSVSVLSNGNSTPSRGKKKYTIFLIFGTEFRTHIRDDVKYETSKNLYA
jgi:hypothetical protein